MQPKQHTEINRKEDGSLIQVISKYVPYWPFFLIFLLLSGIAAFLYLRYTIPKYEANATLIIKDEKKGSDDSKLIESLTLINTKKLIENEIEVLQSRTLMNTVVKKLHLYAPIYQQGKLKSISAYTTSPIKIESLNPDSITTSIIKVNLEFNDKDSSVLLDRNYKGALNQWLNTPYGTLRFSLNEKFTPSAERKPYIFSIFPTKNIAAAILGDLKVSASNKLSSVINLTLRDEIPKRAEDILNELIFAYGEAALYEKNTLAKNTLAFIKERLNVVSKDLSSIEGKLQTYKSGQGAVDISKQGQLYLESVSSTDKRLSDLNMQIEVLAQLEQYASSPGSSGSVPSTLGVSDPSLTQQLNNLSALQLQYDKYKGTVAVNNPVLLSITNQINQIKPTILKNIQSQRASLERAKKDLSAAGEGYSSMLSSIPEKEKQLVEISRDQNIKNGIYSFLLQKREESELSLSSNISDSRIVNYAQSSQFPVSPNKLLVYLVALSLAVICPFALIAAREAFSPKVLYRHEIENLTKIPIVGEVTFSKSKENLVVEPGKRTILAEEFRKIRATLSSFGINDKHKKILITSSIAGEGKSFVAANLATSISLTGKRVILLDIDLHNPGLGKFFGIKNQPGISDYLIGEKDVQEIVYSVPGNKNLYYISSGSLQDDSSELLENGKIQHLVAQINADFDIVIIDTAPVVLITDAYLLSGLCDATLYVVRHKFTPKMLLKRIDNGMIMNPIKNPAIVFNGVKTRGFFKNNYGYGYNYVYGGYGNKKKRESFT